VETLRVEASHWRQRALIAEQESHERGELLHALLLTDVPNS
jgi:hypothetical protein